MANTTEPCGSRFITSDRTLTCDRTDRHLTHRDAATSDRFTRIPFGAYIRPAKR